MLPCRPEPEPECCGAGCPLTTVSASGCMIFFFTAILNHQRHFGFIFMSHRPPLHEAGVVSFLILVQTHRIRSPYLHDPPALYAEWTGVLGVTRKARRAYSLEGRVLLQIVRAPGLCTLDTVSFGFRWIFGNTPSD